MTDIVSDATSATSDKACPLPYISATFNLGLRSKKILAAVAVKHKLQVADIVGRDKFAHFIDARREAILEMHAVGMTHAAIARAMRRERTTIISYTNPVRRARKRIYHARRYREKQAVRAAT